MSEQHTPADAPAAPNRSKLILTIALNLVAPLVLYYGLRMAGSGEVTALLAATAVPSAYLLYQAVSERKIDGFAAFVITMLLLTLAVSFISGSPRFLLAKDGWMTAVGGLWILGTLLTKRPFIFLASRPILEGRIGPRDESWDSLWERLPQFRRVWRLLTVLWGVGTLVDAVIRVVMAYTLPVDLVPALSGVQYAVLYIVLQVASQMYFGRSALMKSEEFAPSEKSADGSESGSESATDGAVAARTGGPERTPTDPGERPEA
jgi:intracellular septation protein A